MSAIRAKDSEAVLVNFGSEDAWAEYEFLFNVGSKQSKPVKFAAYRKWRSTAAPVAFTGMRASFKSRAEAVSMFVQSIGEHGGIVKDASKSTLERLRAKYSDEDT